MPQIILKERAAQLGSYTFFKRDVDQNKNMPLSQLYQPPRTASSQNTYHWLLSFCEYYKVFKNSFYYKTPPETVVCRYSSKQVFLKVLQTSQEGTCVGVSLKKLQAEGLQLLKKRPQRRCFPVKFAKFLRTPFLTEHLRWLLLYFFKKVLFNSYFATLL